MFSHVSYAKATRIISSAETDRINLDVGLVPQTIAMGEVVVTAKRPFTLSKAAEKRASFGIDGNEFERLGEPDPERAFSYLLHDVVRPLQGRLSSDDADLTIHVDGIWKESAYLARG